jgi:hypothetical protein
LVARNRPTTSETGLRTLAQSAFPQILTDPNFPKGARTLTRHGDLVRDRLGDGLEEFLERYDEKAYVQLDKAQQELHEPDCFQCNVAETNPEIFGQGPRAVGALRTHIERRSVLGKRVFQSDAIPRHTKCCTRERDVYDVYDKSAWAVAYME